MARTERNREEEEKKSGRLVGAAETSKELSEWCRLQRKNLNKLGLRKRKEWSHCHRGSSWHVHQSRLYQREMKHSHLSRSPGRNLKESQDEREQHLGKKERDQSGTWRRKNVLHSEERQVSRK